MSDQTVMDCNRLKPCPFCGDSMKMEKTRWARMTVLEMKHKTLSSTLKICHLDYKTAYQNKDFDIYGDRFEQSFIAHWNRRVK